MCVYVCMYVCLCVCLLCINIYISHFRRQAPSFPPTSSILSLFVGKTAFERNTQVCAVFLFCVGGGVCLPCFYNTLTVVESGNKVKAREEAPPAVVVKKELLLMLLLLQLLLVDFLVHNLTFFGV